MNKNQTTFINVTKELNTVTFIKENENWRELLSESPYYLNVTTEGEYTILKYNQIKSDFTNKIVRECRGLILDSTFTPVCVPFFKFGNYGEKYCPEINWGNARVQEKIDGSLIKVWFDKGTWHISTNGTINAYTAPLHNVKHSDFDISFRNFGELFDAAAKISGLSYEQLNKENTYMFELVSPFNQVIVPYPKICIYHLGTRNNRTFEEVEEDIGICKPRMFPITTLNECILAASELSYDEEGYVVVDNNYNRIKIKSPKYVAVAYLKNNKNFMTRRIFDIIHDDEIDELVAYLKNNKNITKQIIDIIRNNEIDEFLVYCNEYVDVVYDIQNKINKIIHRWEEKVHNLEKITFASQKDFALYIKDDVDKGYLFEWKKSGLCAKDHLWKLPNDKIEILIDKI